MSDENLDPRTGVRPEESARSGPRRRRAGRDSRRRPGVAKRLMALALFLVVLLAVLAGVAWWAVFLKPAADVVPGLPVQVEIPEGATTAEIADILSGAGVVANPNMFRLKASSSGLDADLKHGVYDLFTGMEYAEVLEVLAAGPPIDYVTVTIPEGFTLEQIAQRLEEKAGLSSEEFLSLAKEQADEFDRDFLRYNTTSSLEGYLFPKTYLIAEGQGVRDVIEMMLDQFETETQYIDLTYVQQLGLTPHDWVTIASIIEREVRVPEERPLVASVIYNRLMRGMKLEIDATVEYVLPGNRPRLSNADIQIDSPYNTYKYGGLPPGPIASPGLEALKAAADPAETDYIYYVLTGEDGSHTFTETYEEFLRAKERSREVVP
ncbi:MAG: endolytic transglycosylase MltG [Coriobacteriia bacterium]